MVLGLYAHDLCKNAKNRIVISFLSQTLCETAVIKTRGKLSVTNTIERSFSGSGKSLARVIGKQTFTGKRRGTAKKNKATKDVAEARPGWLLAVEKLLMVF